MPPPWRETNWAAAHGPLITRFLRALQEASTYVAAHETEVMPP